MKIQEHPEFEAYDGFAKNFIATFEVLERLHFVLVGNYFCWTGVSPYWIDRGVAGDITTDDGMSYTITITVTPGGEWTDSHGVTGSVWKYQFFSGNIPPGKKGGEWFITSNSGG